MASRDVEGRMETDETSNLISASKVQGTTVYNADGDDIGSIYDVMLEKVGGKVSYAVMSIGGFLGMGADYHPIPWNRLSYDTNLGGYVLKEPVERLKAAPTMSRNFATDPDWEQQNAGWTRRVDEYYGMPI